MMASTRSTETTERSLLRALFQTTSLKSRLCNRVFLQARYAARSVRVPNEKQPLPFYVRR